MDVETHAVRSADDAGDTAAGFPAAGFPAAGDPASGSRLPGSPAPGDAAPGDPASGAPAGSRTGGIPLLGVLLSVLGVVASGAVAYLLDVRATERAAAEFDRNVEQSTAAIEGEIGRYVDTLGTLGSFVVSRDRPTPETFEEFVDTARVFERFDQMLGVIVVERTDDVVTLAEDVRRVDPSFTVLEIADAPVDATRYVVTYYVPGALELPLPVGLDMTPIESMRGELRRREQDGSAAAGAVQHDPLIQEFVELLEPTAVALLIGEIDFFIGVPTYAPGTDGAGGAPPAAWVAAPVTGFDALLASTVNEQPDDLGLVLSVEIADPVLAGQTVSRAVERQDAPGPLADAAFTSERRFEVEGIEWTVTAWSGPGAGSPARWAALLVLGAGALASVLAGTVVVLRARGRDRHRAYVSLKAEHDRATFQRDVLASVSDAVAVLDTTGAVVEVNDAWDALRRRHARVGVEPGADRGRRYVEVIGELAQGAGAVEEIVGAVLRGGGAPAEVDLAIGGEPPAAWVSVTVTPLRAGTGGAVAVHRDVTRQKRSEAALEAEATHDPLTGVLNRAGFDKRAAEVLERARDREVPLAALYVDLDGFKEINDTFGHGTGDVVLQIAAARLRRSVRADDLVARFGGDEFVVLLADASDPGLARRTAERIGDNLRAPMRAATVDLEVSASVGVASLAPRGDVSASTIVRRADRAMYEAKRRGGSDVTFER